MDYKLRLDIAKSNNVRERTIPKGQSKAILINDCPFCQYKKVCQEYMHADGAGHLLQMCILRSWDLESVWITVGEDRAKVNIGDRFGQLTVRNFRDYDQYGNPLWVCECDCGNHKTVRGADLLSLHTKSCGCLKPGPKKDMRGTENIGLKVNKWDYSIGSSTNPDGTTHKFTNGYEGDVGKAVCHVVETRDDGGVIRRSLQHTKCKCSGQIRIDEHGDHVCVKCNLVH